MTTAALLLLALVLDAVFGEPAWLWSRLPHPAVVMGRLIGWLDQRFNADGRRVLKGGLIFALIFAGAWVFGALLARLPGGPVIEVVLAAILIAQKSLAQHVRAVADGLRISLGDGRLMVARIVGRDTADMDEAAVARGAIESAAENFSDGVVAPAFWFLIFGLPGLLAYKMTNTADSMIGYLTPRHADFGRVAARADDVLNWIPARLSAVLILAATTPPRRWRQGWQRIRRDAPLHRSPNAGWPEAAMAFALGVALSGPRTYAGETRDYPFVCPEGAREIGAAEIDAATNTLWRGWAALAFIVMVVAII